jgi:hypothetical protein
MAGYPAATFQRSQDFLRFRLPDALLHHKLNRGELLLLRQLDGDEPEEGETLLMDLGVTIDPDSQMRVSLRQWWPIRDELGSLVGLRLKGRPLVECRTF